MNKKILWGIIILLVVLAGTALATRFFLGGDEDAWFCQDNDWIKHGNPDSSMPASDCGQEEERQEPSAGLANPASVNCIDKGGALEMRADETGGQYGICKFTDGSECEEWQFFRGECSSSESPE